LEELGIEVINGRSMCTECEKRSAPSSNGVYTYTGDTGIWEGLGKDGETNSVLFFSPGNIILELCEENENKSVFIPGFGKNNLKMCFVKVDICVPVWRPPKFSPSFGVSDQNI
jgi:hypothetical protein